MYFNYKGNSSVVLMAVADADYQFVYVDVGGYGKNCDSTIFQQYTLWKRTEEGTMDLPTSETFEKPQTQNCHIF